MTGIGSKARNLNNIEKVPTKPYNPITNGVVVVDQTPIKVYKVNKRIRFESIELVEVWCF